MTYRIGQSVVHPVTHMAGRIKDVIASHHSMIPNLVIEWTHGPSSIVKATTVSVAANDNNNPDKLIDTSKHESMAA